MFVGHLAVGLAAKARAPRTSLGVFVAAALGLDLIWPIFLLLGIEHVHVEPGITKFTPLAFDSYPWTHSLVMAVVWGLLGAFLVRLRKRKDVRTQGLVFVLVVSHWVLDFASHRPDMPLWPGNSPHVGLGLWNSIPATFIVEGLLFALGLFLYLRTTQPVDLLGSIVFWFWVAVSTFMWAGQPWSPPPPNQRSLALFSLVVWLLPLWAGWADSHRVWRRDSIAQTMAKLHRTST